MVLVVLAVAAYLLGSVPFGVVVTRVFTGRDVRAVGSGNIGASNVTRAAGKGAGVLTLVLDAAKSALPMLATLHFFAGGGRSTAELYAVVVGFAAFVGHLFPLWLRFKGGKGVATALGVFVVIAPIPALLAVVTFGVAFAATRIPAVGSLAGTLACAAGTVIQAIDRGGAPWKSPVAWAAVLIALVIIFRHRTNIERLMKGSEHKV